MLFSFEVTNVRQSRNLARCWQRQFGNAATDKPHNTVLGTSREVSWNTTHLKTASWALGLVMLEQSSDMAAIW